MGAALDPAPKHTRHRHVGSKIGPARHLVDAVRADRPGADYLQRRLVEIAHLHPPSSVYDAAHGYQKNRRCARFSGLLLGRKWSPTPLIRLINNQDRAKRQMTIVCPKVASGQRCVPHGPSLPVARYTISHHSASAALARRLIAASEARTTRALEVFGCDL